MIIRKTQQNGMSVRYLIHCLKTGEITQEEKGQMPYSNEREFFLDKNKLLWKITTDYKP